MKYWYLIHTKIRQETRALANLEFQDFKCYLPLVRIEKLRRGSFVTMTEPLFPRYLFIQLDTDTAGKSWTPIRSTLGVSKLVTFGNYPAKIDESLIEMIKSKSDDAEVLRQQYSPGQTVVISKGPFSGLEAVYQMETGENRVMVLLDIMSKVAKLSLDLGAIRKVAVL